MKLGSQIIKQMHEGLETLIIGQTLINLYLNLWFLRTGKKKKLQDYYNLNLPTEEQCVWKMKLPSRAPLLKVPLQSRKCCLSILLLAYSPQKLSLQRCP